MERQAWLSNSSTLGNRAAGCFRGLSHFADRFDSLWVGANDGDLANRTDAFHQSAQ